MRRADKKETKGFFEENKEILARLGHTEASIFSAKCSLLRDHLSLDDIMILEVHINHLVGIFWSMVNAIYAHDMEAYKKDKANLERSIKDLIKRMDMVKEEEVIALREKMI